MNTHRERSGLSMPAGFAFDKILALIFAERGVKASLKLIKFRPKVLFVPVPQG